MTTCTVCNADADTRPIYHVCERCQRGRCARCYCDASCLCSWSRFIARHPEYPRQTLTEWAYRGMAMPRNEPLSAR